MLPAHTVCPEEYAAFINATASSATAPFNSANASAAAAAAANTTTTHTALLSSLMMPVAPLVCAGAGADHALVPFYAVGASLWAIYFFKEWRRYQSALIFRWDVSDFAQEEPTRPQFHRHPATRHDRVGFYDAEAGFMPFGDVVTPYFSGAARSSRFCCSMVFTAFVMATVAIGTIGIFAIKLAIAQVSPTARPTSPPLSPTMRPTSPHKPYHTPYLAPP
jgi:hypothetical protein